MWLRRSKIVSCAVPVLAILSSPSGHAEELTACPVPSVQAEIRETSGSNIDALMNAVAFMERRYGQPHSRKRVSTDEVRMIYRSGKGALSVSLARDGGGRITVDCITYRRAGSD